MDLLLLGDMGKALKRINFSIRMVSMLMMMINAFILLTKIIIVLLNGNIMQRLVKLLQVEMEKEIEWIN
jgi:hypothetical protein